MLQQQTKLKMKKTRLLAPMLMIFLLSLIFTSTMLVQGIPLDDDDKTDETEETEDPEETEDTEETDEEETDEEDHDDEDEDGVDDDLEAANEREIEVEISEDGTELTIKSKLKVGENEDEFKIEVELEEGLEAELEYSTEADDLEAELVFKVNFYSLVEYEDVDGDGIFNETEDSIVQTIVLEEFEPMSYEVINTDTHKITVTTTDGVFTCIIYAVGEFASLDGTTVTPTEVKIDIIINNFNYLSETSNLALYIRLETESEYEYEDETEDEKEGYAEGESALGTTMNTFTGFFSWIDSATVDGVIQPVTASLHDEDDFEDDEDDEWEQKIYLNYPHGTNIVHDPKIGVAGILLEAPSPSTPSEIVSKLLLELSKEGYLSSMAIFTLLVLGISVLFRRRRG